MLFKTARGLISLALWPLEEFSLPPVVDRPWEEFSMPPVVDWPWEEFSMPPVVDWP
jgi:hypothetical protein